MGYKRGFLKGSLSDKERVIINVINLYSENVCYAICTIHYLDFLFSHYQSITLYQSTMKKMRNLYLSKKNVLKVKKVFPKNFMPYEIGFISKERNTVNFLNYLKW